MKKKLLTTFAASLLLLSLMGTASATSFQLVNYNLLSSASTEVEPRAEQTTWYFRTIDGKNQMRLWSITEGKWLTDWIDM